MKFLLVLVSCVALCVSHSIPTIPGDNSHYVEGESRYIWMSDADGKPELVDLQAPVDESILQDTRNGANNQYWLFTRRNQNSRQVITHNNANSVWNSNFLGRLPINVVVHGLNNNGASLNNVKDAFLAAQDCNVIMVDWSRLAGSGYPTAVNGVPSVGQHVGNFITWIVNLTGGNWNNVHLVGFSLGAHVSGVASRQTGRRVRRVTGLDPAGPGWHSNGNRLQSNDAQYVEGIHTDGQLLGIFNPVGDADFYPNGGKHMQPGCSALDSPCSHGRSHQYFDSSVRRNRLVGERCANLASAELGRCSGGARMNMGNGINNKSGSGLYHLRTSTSFPWEI